MSKIISQWLQNRLGIIFNQHSWDEDHGGGIIAKLLQSYALLTEEQVNIIFARQGAFYEPTLEVVRLAVNRLGLNVSKQEFQDVVDAKDMAPTKLLYELYLVLHDKDASHFILSQQLHDQRANSRFAVENSMESSGKFEYEKFSNPLASPLDAQDEIIQFHINKHFDLLQRCKESRERYLNFVQENRQMDNSRLVRMQNTSACRTRGEIYAIEQLPLDAVSLNQSATDLMKETKAAQKMESIKPNKNVSNQIIKDIQAKAFKSRQLQGSRESFRKTVLKDLWEKVLYEQELYFKERFTERLQQQSIYEQQMASSLIAVRENQNQIAADKKHMMEMLREAQEQQFLRKLLNEDRMKEYERTAYYVEQERKKYLHQKLYDRKQKRKAERIKDDCRRALNDILDIAFHNIEYNETHNDELPRRKRDDLARLFVSQQPIFDLIDDVARVIEVNPSLNSANEEESFVETIKISELERQNAIDDLTLDDYLTYKWPWDFMSFMSFENYDDVIKGMTVLAHIVKRLLLAKYPRVHVTGEPPLIRKEVAACFTGLYDLDFLPALKQLLLPRKIIIVQLQDCIEHCIRMFKAEVSQEYLETILVKETDEALKNIESNAKGFKDGSKALKKGSKKGSWTSGRLSAEVGSIHSVENSQNASDENPVEAKPVDDEPGGQADKGNQTPKQFPCEELKLSSAGDVGRELFIALHLGDTPSEHVNASAIIEYLKCLDWTKYNGWVLVNYPQTFQQAIALEESLSSCRIPVNCVLPKDCLDDIIDIARRPDIDDDGMESKRHSKLLECVLNQDSHGIVGDEYKTFLTSFIELKSRVEADPREKYYECFKDSENTAALCRFYQEQGCKYNLFYNTIDFPTIKHLGKLILGDFSMPPKNSETLFTDTVKYVEATFDKLYKPTSVAVKEEPPERVKTPKKEKKEKEENENRNSEEKELQRRKKSSKGSPKGSVDKGSKKDKASKKGQKDRESTKDKQRKSSGFETNEVEKIDQETQVPTPSLHSVVASDESEPSKKVYYDLPIMQYYLDGLATLWENVEEIYINDMKQLFFRRRVILDQLIPYNTYVKTNMMEFIQRPDIKQQYLSEFQRIYNDFSDDMREDEEVKSELHLRIEEFKEKLSKICDDRMVENEIERVRIIQENWMATVLIAICNIYVSFLQLEIDRCGDTMQLIVDYYSAMMTGGPWKDPPLTKLILETIQLPKNVEDMDHIAPFTEDAAGTLKQVDKKVDANESIYVIKMKFILETALNKIEENLVTCQKIKIQLSTIFDLEKILDKETRELMQALHMIDPDEEVKVRVNSLLWELSVSIVGEYYRSLLRLKILEHAYIEEIQDIMGKCAGNFHNLYNEIEKRYRNEIHAVNEASELLKRAVEEESKIQPEMVLDGDCFYVKLGSLMYESPLPDVDDVPLKEIQNEETFTISQLSRISDILNRVAPKGILPERAFAYLLQDFLVHKAEDDKEDYVPCMWKKLEPTQTNEFMFKLFLVTEYVNWKDFVVYCMDIRFPDEHEIITTRQQFRELDPDMTEFIYEHQYPAMRYWFENEIEEPRLREIRILLYKLYSVNNRLNYPSLLIDFCKDKDPVMGFVKALEVSLGKLVCHDEAQGSERYANTLKRIMRKDIKRISQMNERQDTMHMSRDMVEKLVADITNPASTVFTDIQAPEVSPLCPYDVMQYWQDSQKNTLSSNSITETSSITNSETLVGENTPTGITGGQSQDGIIYQINFDVLLNIFSVTWPWVHKVRQFSLSTFHEMFSMIYNSLINEDIPVAYLYQILTNQDFLSMFKQFYKFYDKNPSMIVKEILIRDGNF